jgi:hypothetical protein
MAIVSYYLLLCNVNVHETIGLFLNHFQDIKDDALAFSRATLLVTTNNAYHAPTSTEKTSGR